MWMLGRIFLPILPLMMGNQRNFVCTCSCVGVQMYRCMWWPWVNVRCLPQLLPHLSFWDKVSLNLEITILVDSWGTVSGISLSLPPQHGDYRYATLCHLFTWEPGIQLQDCVLMWQALYWQSHLQTLKDILTSTIKRMWLALQQREWKPVWLLLLLVKVLWVHKDF